MTQSLELGRPQVKTDCKQESLVFDDAVEDSLLVLAAELRRNGDPTGIEHLSAFFAEEEAKRVLKGGGTRALIAHGIFPDIAVLIDKRIA